MGHLSPPCPLPVPPRDSQRDQERRGGTCPATFPWDFPADGTSQPFPFLFPPAGTGLSLSTLSQFSQPSPVFPTFPIPVPACRTSLSLSQLFPTFSNFSYSCPHLSTPEQGLSEPHQSFPVFLNLSQFFQPFPAFPIPIPIHRDCSEPCQSFPAFPSFSPSPLILGLL